MSSSAGWQIELWLDPNGNGDAGDDGVLLATDPNGDQLPVRTDDAVVDVPANAGLGITSADQPI